MQYYIVMEKTQDKFGPYTERKANARLTQEGFLCESGNRWRKDDVVAFVRPITKRKK